MFVLLARLQGTCFNDEKIFAKPNMNHIKAAANMQFFENLKGGFWTFCNLRKKHPHRF